MALCIFSSGSKVILSWGEIEMFCPVTGTHPCPMRGWRLGVGLGTLLQSCCITPHVTVCWEASIGISCDWVPPLVLINVDTLHICLGVDVICAAGQTWQRQERGYSQELRSSRADKYLFTLTKLALRLSPHVDFVYHHQTRSWHTGKNT